jgi:hypothetical protein
MNKTPVNSFCRVEPHFASLRGPLLAEIAFMALMRSTRDFRFLEASR